jgi:hypothetical protein
MSCIAAQQASASANRIGTSTGTDTKAEHPDTEAEHPDTADEHQILPSSSNKN